MAAAALDALTKRFAVQVVRGRTTSGSFAGIALVAFDEEVYCSTDPNDFDSTP